MDSDNQNPNNINQRPMSGSSVDGFMPAPSPTVGGAVPSYSDSGNTDTNPKAELGQQVLNTAVNKPVGRGKAVKVLLVVFAALFLIAVGAGSYLFLQYDTTKKDLVTEKATSQSLAAQLDAAESTAATQATQSATDLEIQTDYAASMSTIASELKTKCGTACSSITIPTIPD